MNLGVGSQMDLTRGLVSSVVQAMCISTSKGVLACAQTKLNSG